MGSHRALAAENLFFRKQLAKRSMAWRSPSFLEALSASSIFRVGLSIANQLSADPNSCFATSALHAQFPPDDRLLLLGRSSPVGLSGKGHLEADALGIEEFIESALPR
jgi:hypothetical protein